jgi:hypothetical protein
VLRWYLEERGRELSREPFGAAALTTPPDSALNRLSWLLPYAQSVIAFVVLFLVGRRWVRSARTSRPDEPASAGTAAVSPDPKVQAEYEQLLDRELRKLD